MNRWQQQAGISRPVIGLLTLVWVLFAAATVISGSAQAQDNGTAPGEEVTEGSSESAGDAAEGLAGSSSAGQVLPRPAESVPIVRADDRIQISALSVWPAEETLLDSVVWRLVDDLTGCVEALPPETHACGWQLIQIERDRHTGQISVGYKADALDHGVELCIRSAANENHAESPEEAMPFGVSLAVVVSGDPEQLEECGQGSEAAIEEWIRSRK